MSDCLPLAVLQKLVTSLNAWLPSLNRSRAKALPSLTPQESSVFAAIVLVTASGYDPQSNELLSVQLA